MVCEDLYTHTKQPTDSPVLPPIIGKLTQQARELITKRPGIYKGNLMFWLMEKEPQATRWHIELAFLQLLKQGYFFSYEDSVYPPHTVSDEVKILTQFVSKEGLSFTDYGILYEIHQDGGFQGLRRFSRYVVSRGWGEDEEEVRRRVQDLLLQKIILQEDQRLKINWPYLREAVR